MTAHIITPQDQPKFPCWLWCSGSSCVPDVEPSWCHIDSQISFNSVKWAGWIYSHYHPDQPEPPAPITSEPASKAATTAVHCDRCDPSFTCWSSHESPCRKVATPPTPAGAEELALKALDQMLEVLGEYEKKKVYFSDVANACYSARCEIDALARHFQSLREELARVKSREKELVLEAFRAGNAPAVDDPELGVVAPKSDLSALRTENAALRDNANKALQELKTVHTYVQSVKNHIPIEIVAKVLNAESILSK